MKNPFDDSSEQLKERLRRIVQKPNFLRAAELALLACMVLCAGLLLIGAFRGSGEADSMEQQAVPETIQITAMPYHTVFIKGQPLDPAELKLLLTYRGGL